MFGEVPFLDAELNINLMYCKEERERNRHAPPVKIGKQTSGRIRVDDVYIVMLGIKTKAMAMRSRLFPSLVPGEWT